MSDENENRASLQSAQPHLAAAGRAANSKLRDSLASELGIAKMFDRIPQLVALATAVSAFLIALRTLEIARWNFDAAIVLLSHLNLAAALISIGSLGGFALFMAWITAVSTSHVQGGLIRRKVGIIVASALFTLVFMPLLVGILASAIWLLNAIMYSSTVETWMAKMKSPMQKPKPRGVFVGVLIGSALLFLLPVGTYVSGVVAKLDGTSERGLIIDSGSQVLVFEPKEQSFSYVDYHDISKLVIDRHTEGIWYQSVVSLLLESSLKGSQGTK
jgi:hypothetical protein